MVYSLKQLETSYYVSKQLDLAQFIQHESNSRIEFSKWNQSITRKSRDPPRQHICNICLRTFPQIRHRASSVFCLQHGVEYRPSDSFLFCLNRRLVGCWEQPPEQNFAMSVIYIWHVQQQLTAVQISDEGVRLTRQCTHTHTHTDINTSVLSVMSESRRSRLIEQVLFTDSIEPIRRAFVNHMTVKRHLFSLWNIDNSKIITNTEISFIISLYSLKTSCPQTIFWKLLEYKELNVNFWKYLWKHFKWSKIKVSLLLWNQQCHIGFDGVHM